MKPPGSGSLRSSGRPKRRRSSSRRAPRRRSTRWLTPGATPSSERGTTSSSARWSTTRTSGRGRCWPNARGPKSACCRSTRRERCARTSCRRSWTNVRAWWPSRRRPTRSARGPTCGRWSKRRMPSGPLSLSTAVRAWFTAGSMSGRWTATSTPSRATNSTGRRESACCTASANCWNGCRRSWAAATWSTR